MDPISTKIALGAAGGGGVSDYWYATLGNNSDYFLGVDFDSLSNVNAAGHANPVGNSEDGLVAQYDQYGNINWQRRIYKASTNFDYIYDVKTDSNDDVHVAGYCYNNSTSHIILYAKYDSSGTLLRDKEIDQSGVFNRARGLALDSSGNIYIAGYEKYYNNAHIIKLNSVGNLVWETRIAGGYSTTTEGIAVDSTGNSYVILEHTTSSFATYATVLKLDSSGVLQWARRLLAQTQSAGFYVTVDGNDDVYCVGRTRTNVGSTFAGFIVKLDSSGTDLWYNTIGGTSTNDYCEIYGVTVDSSDNVYVAGYTRNSSTNNRTGLVVKFNSSGVTQWQREFTDSSNTSQEFFSIAVDNLGAICAAGRTNLSGNNGALLVKVPDDGSLTGTHGSYTWQASSYSIGTYSMSITNVNGDFSNTAITSTVGSAGTTEVASTLTSSTTNI